MLKRTSDSEPTPNATRAWAAYDAGIAAGRLRMATWVSLDPDIYSPDVADVELADLQAAPNECGATACLAGWGIALAGYAMERYSCDVYDPNGFRLGTAQSVAAHLFGLDDTSAFSLFRATDAELEGAMVSYFGPRPTGEAEAGDA